MNMKSDEIRLMLDQIFEDFPKIRKADIPGIDLYMDQVTTFLQDNLSSISRDPDGDKFLTKTMINNYVKNKVLFPPVKKKYSRDHMMLLLMIYYMKSFLSISDIRSITGPIIEYCVPDAANDKKRESPDKKREPAADRKSPRGEKAASREKEIDTNDQAERRLALPDLYDKIMDDIEKMLPDIRREILEQIEQVSNDFEEIPGEDRELLQQFSLICRLSTEVYIRKLLIEKLLDANFT